MLTDYAQQNKPPKRNHKRIVLTIIILLIAILLPLTMFYVRYHNTTAHHKEQKAAALKKSSLPPKKPKDTQPQFDFYTLLPKMGVPIQKTEPHTPKNQSENFTYALQISAVRSHHDAKRLSRRLINMGYPAYTQSYQSASGNTWYRVLVGPYQTIYAADSDQRQLHNKNHLESLLLTMPVYRAHRAGRG